MQDCKKIIEEFIKKLEVLEHEVFGCGNGKVKINSFIKQIKRDYDIK